MKAYYYCQACDTKHTVKSIASLKKHIDDIKAKGLNVLFLKQGKANMLKVR